MDAPTPSGPWSRDRVDEFLTTTTMPVRVSCRTPADDLWMLSLWYEWDPETPELRCATSADADVVGFLRAYDDVAFEISTNDPPYRGVRGRGVATVEPDDEKRLLKRLVHRYLGSDDSTLAQRLLSPDRDEVTIRMRPTKLHTWDYTSRMRSKK
ncbi:MULTISPECIES: pyridoxamine 5'-phosphate oxidase family protein [Haloferax]|uniref:Pyridoxamine 5'-phosphate oxidase family protein n=1 Tax=Haloferax marinum TaxID=2666143 RepID=A0A6A8G9I1_9EURY|nr:MULTISPECIES: pyridoxamine 5'-phosphate oxidase family protein [Haloferax]KAB1198152.1 pyridoxamine 5'-phosphate oxidase family protein [Haloferax sp. CBA1150]MRW97232.1 pyridoxamine 5'-phosphate oxidase family protein [Haloferax marinum]